MQNVNFTTPFYAPPVILTTVTNGGRSDAPCSVKGPLSAWLEVRTVRVEIELLLDNCDCQDDDEKHRKQFLRPYFFRKI